MNKSCVECGEPIDQGAWECVTCRGWFHREHGGKLPAGRLGDVVFGNSGRYECAKCACLFATIREGEREARAQNATRKEARRKMVENIGKRVDRIFDIYDEAREAEVRGDHETLEKKLIDGLAVGCILLRDLVKETGPSDPKSRNHVWRELRRLEEDKRLPELFQVLEDWLLKANVKKKTVITIVDTVSQTVDFLIENKPDREPNWHGRLTSLEGEICQAAGDTSKIRDRRKLLRSATIVAGGALIVTLAVTGVIPATASVAGILISTGGISREIGRWIIERGAENALKEKL